MFAPPQTLITGICLCNTINPIQTSLLQDEGSESYVIIEPILEEDEQGKLICTGQYKFIKTSSVTKQSCSPSLMKVQ
jgi:hypothetical protein